MVNFRSYRWHVVAMLWAISFCNYADRQAIFTVFPLLERQMHLSPSQLGLLGSSFAIVYGIGAQFAGMVVDRIQRRAAILGGLQVWSVICMATGLFSSYRALLLLRAAEGLGETFYFPASMSMLSDYHSPSTRSRAIGIHQTSVYMGTIAGGFFAGLIGQAYGWRWSFLVFGGAGVLLGLVLQRLLREPVRGASDGIALHKLSTSETVKAIWRNPGAVLLMAAFLCANFVAAVLLSWMPKFVYDRFHMTLAMAGLTATLFVQLASLAGSLLGGWMADWWHEKRPSGRMLVQAAGVLGGAPFVVLCGTAHSISALIAALTVWGLCKGLYDANIFASMFDVVPAEGRGTAAGFMNTVGWLGGGATAPFVIGIVAERGGLGFGIALASVVYVLAGIFLLLAATQARPATISSSVTKPAAP